MRRKGRAISRRRIERRADRRGWATLGFGFFVGRKINKKKKSNVNLLGEKRKTCSTFSLGNLGEKGEGKSETRTVGLDQTGKGKGVN